MPNGIGNRPQCCAGCCQTLEQRQPRISCTFGLTGFPFDGDGGMRARPCGTRCHYGCVQLGPPFTTRLKIRAGLYFSGKIRTLTSFICEACTVRAVLQRELRLNGSDLALVALERARLVDMLNSWSDNTHSQYQGHLRYVAKFEHDFGVTILETTPLVCPPHPPSIPTMWAQQRYALQPSPSTRAHRAGENLAFGTVRQMRSAVSMFYRWDWNVAYPGGAVQDSNDRFFLADRCSPTDSIAYTAMTKGLGTRIGDNPKGAVALLARHVHFIDKALDNLYHTSADPGVRADTARAGLSNAFGWLCWFRASELFEVPWSTLLVVDPGTGGRFELPDHVGGVRFRFTDPQKTSRAKDTELWCAYTSGSGLSVGKWLHRLRRTLRMSSFSAGGSNKKFQRSNGQKWTSEHFRQTYLIPFLELQRLQGDPYLGPYGGVLPGSRLSDAFFSYHAYRSGARTHVKKKRADCIRKATIEEVYGHGRWHLVRSSQPIDVQYDQPPVLDQLAITIFSM
jgi:hypothetical protein